MKLKSMRSIGAVLFGILVSFLLSIFVRPTCWGPFIGVIVALYVAKVSSPKEGALTGALVPVPAGIYATIPMLVRNLERSQEAAHVLRLFLDGVIVAVILVFAGAICGAILGMLFQKLKSKESIMF